VSRDRPRSFAFETKSAVVTGGLWVNASGNLRMSNAVRAGRVESVTRRAYGADRFWCGMTRYEECKPLLRCPKFYFRGQELGRCGQTAYFAILKMR
jgi:hypothetical protein